MVLTAIPTSKPSASSEYLLRHKIFLWAPKAQVVFTSTTAWRWEGGGCLGAPRTLHCQDTGALDFASWALGWKKCWRWLLWLSWPCYFREYINIHWVQHRNYIPQCLRRSSKTENVLVQTQIWKRIFSLSHMSQMSMLIAWLLRLPCSNYSTSYTIRKYSLYHRESESASEACQVAHDFPKCDLYSCHLSKSYRGET